ncbi:unnamed protein product [Urochloa humidicola]
MCTRVSIILPSPYPKHSAQSNQTPAPAGGGRPPPRRRSQLARPWRHQHAVASPCHKALVAAPPTIVAGSSLELDPHRLDPRDLTGLTCASTPTRPSPEIRTPPTSSPPDLCVVMATPGMGTDQSIFPHPTLGNTEDQSMSDLPFPHPLTSLLDADISLTSSHHHPSLGNSGDQSMDRPLLPTDLLDIDPSEFDAFDWSAAPGQICQPAPGSSGDDSFLTPGGALHVAVGNELREPAGHGSRVQMDGCTDVSTPTVGTILELEDVGTRVQPIGPQVLQLHVGHVASSSATGRDYQLCRKSALGFIQPDTAGTDGVGDPRPPTTPGKIRVLVDRLTEKHYQNDPDLIHDLKDAVLFLNNMRPKSSKLGLHDISHRFVDPHDPPTANGRYITTFMARLEGDEDKPKVAYWKEKDVKAIRDPSAAGKIIGLKRTLAYTNGSKRTHWLADEYIALDPWDPGAVQIQGEMVVRKVYEEGRETAPPSKCSKPDAHSSGESYIWQHMTRVYVKGEGGSTAAPSLLYAICHECDKALKCPPKFGNGNLNKHLERVHDICSPCKSQHVMAKGKGVGAGVVRV